MSPLPQAAVVTIVDVVTVTSWVPSYYADPLLPCSTTPVPPGPAYLTPTPSAPLAAPSYTYGVVAPDVISAPPQPPAPIYIQPSPNTPTYVQPSVAPTYSIWSAMAKPTYTQPSPPSDTLAPAPQQPPPVVTPDIVILTPSSPPPQPPVPSTPPPAPVAAPAPAPAAPAAPVANGGFATLCDATNAAMSIKFDFTQQGFLSLVNSLRSVVGGALGVNLPPMTYSAAAQAIATNSVNKRPDCQLVEGDVDGAGGTNLFFLSAAVDPADTTALWQYHIHGLMDYAAECRFLTFADLQNPATIGRNDFANFGHYTPLVWSTTTEIAVAVKVCTAPSPASLQVMKFENGTPNFVGVAAIPKK
ncbi:hypothetical protein HK101_004041 [Irineochytrium annulatum]|nr:hypothetical protein HK101_004041 [Irineochytrium annulatum]